MKKYNAMLVIILIFSFIHAENNVKIMEYYYQKGSLSSKLIIEKMEWGQTIQTEGYLGFKSKKLYVRMGDEFYIFNSGTLWTWSEGTDPVAYATEVDLSDFKELGKKLGKIFSINVNQDENEILIQGIAIEEDQWIPNFEFSAESSNKLPMWLKIKQKTGTEIKITFVNPRFKNPPDSIFDILR